MVVFIKMMLARIIKKLNKSYSIVIIPNSNDKIKKLSLKAPKLKMLITLVFVLSMALSVTIFINSSKADNDIDSDTKQVSNEELQKQVQNLSKIVAKQNETLTLSNSELNELKANDAFRKNQITEFTEMYNKIAEKYISKTSRGSTSKTNKNTALDLLKLSEIIGDLNKNVTIDEKLSSELELTNKNLQNYVDAIPTLIPAGGEITSPFGRRLHPISKVYKEHKGVDIDAQKGSGILAAASGIVEFSGYSSGYGYNVIIDHKNGFRTIYAHSSKLLVKQGANVKKGQKIALVGSTGTSTGPHLHFEIRLGNSPVDPTEYIDF
jgi:murein DD-endopeptidase MepM/ murein hydrolase activator NlpD